MGGGKSGGGGRVGEEGGKRGEDGGMRGGLGIGGRVTSPLTKVTIWSPNVRLRVHETLGNAPNKELLGGGLMGGVCIGLDSD